MEKFKCVIIDDDRYAIDGLRAYINEVPNLELIKTYQNPIEALVDFATLPMIDLILLDIHMPQITGIELAKEIRSKTKKLIFTTSYTHYGYEAFEAQADGYLLKPYSLTKFTSTVSKAFAHIERKYTPPSKDQYFFVKNTNDHLRIVKVWYNDIVAVESKQNYVLIHTVHKDILTYMSLTSMAKMLSDNPDFVQFQRSFIIAKSHIDSIVGNTVKMDNSLEFTVGDLYRTAFQKFVHHKLLRTGV
ncbi:LytTR family DNA-binding domain-containing protein [Mucilaginibacter sp. PAMB04274]|uniref:LytR/AlgR family response regulator transcription factor n=1 Tax=Mucilaginibacter sp. PAMB04274 TaxID=3138568 RepID=UPI0031F71BD5